jgi:hypothetical protein
MGRHPGRIEASGVVRGAGARRPTRHQGASMRSHWIAHLTAVADYLAGGPLPPDDPTCAAPAGPRVDEAAGNGNSEGWAGR